MSRDRRQHAGSSSGRPSPAAAGATYLLMGRGRAIRVRGIVREACPSPQEGAVAAPAGQIDADSREAMRDLLRECAGRRAAGVGRRRRRLGLVSGFAFARASATKQEERERLAPWAARAGDSAGRLVHEAEHRLSHRLSARPRSHRPCPRLPATRIQDPGLRVPGERSLPQSPDPYDRGRPGRAHDRAGAASQRGPRRGDRAGPRPRPHALRPRRRGRARRAAWRTTAASTTIARACASSICSRIAIPTSAAST